MIIRPANITDIDKILVLEEQIFRLHSRARPDWVDETKRLFNYDFMKNCIDSDSGKIFLAEDESSNIIGYCATYIKEIINHQVFRDMRNLEIEDLCIDEKYRGKGIGKKLFEEVVKYGKENGVKFIELSVWEFNQNAKKFYEHLGMKTKTKTNRMELNICS
jgi:ribosomal protein S18 acetylase RimI-like enzyme